MAQYIFNKTCAIDRLTQEVQLSSIVTALDYMNGVVGQTDVFFKAALSAGDETVLNGLVNAHVATPLPENVIPSVVLAGETDSDGAQITRPKVTKTGWHYEPRTIGWKCSTAGSLHNTSISGTNIGDATMKFYDAGGAELTKGGLETDELFQIRLLATCVRTVMDWWPQFDMEIIAGMILLKNLTAPSAYIHVIAAPDIPANLGGSIPFSNGGFDLSFLFDAGTGANIGKLEVDGKAVKKILFDPVYQSNKFRFQVTHPVGYVAALQLMYRIYKA